MTHGLHAPVQPAKGSLYVSYRLERPTGSGRRRALLRLIGARRYVLSFENLAQLFHRSLMSTVSMFTVRKLME